MTEELYERLSQYEETLRKAKDGYYRESTHTLNELDGIYKELFPNRPSKVLNGCSRCVLKCLKELGEAYDAYKVGKETEPTPTEAPTVRKRRNKATNKEEE